MQRGAGLPRKGGLYLEGKYFSTDCLLLSEDAKSRFCSALDGTGSGSFAFSAQWRNNSMQAVLIW